jgi:anti-repressor protein
MNEMIAFNNPEFGEIRGIEIDGKPYFVARDVAAALGYANTRDAIIKHCRWVVKRDGVSSTTNQYGITTEQTVEMNFIPRSDVYRLITHSHLPAAEKFESWVFDEVLPAIADTGGYIPTKGAETDEEILARAVKIADRTIERQKRLIDEQARKIEDDRPKVIFADAVSVSDKSILIGDLAKLIKQNGYDIGQNRLFEWLRRNGYLISNQGTNYNRPTQHGMNLGLFEIKERVIMKPNGESETFLTSYVTPKGQIYFINKFMAMKQKSA